MSDFAATRSLLVLAFSLTMSAQSAFGSQSCNRLSNSHLLLLLRSQGFTSSTDSGTKLVYIGRVAEKSGECFAIYFYNHINIHPAKIPHGLQKLIVMENGEKYVGSYLLSMDDPIPVVVNSDLRFDLPAKIGNRIHFGPNGPPHTALVNGTNLALER